MTVSKLELTIGILGLVAYFFSYFAQLHRVRILLGFIFGAWILTRGSEVTVDGLHDTSIHVGLQEYDAGVFSSLAATIPELVLASLMVFRGLVEVGVLSVVVASGFNIVLLGLLITLLSWKEGELEFPYERISHEADLIRMTIIICVLIFGLGIICNGGGVPKLPREIGVFLLLSYAAYMIFMLTKKRKKGEGTSTPTVDRSLKQAASLLIVGFLGVIIGGELITSSAEFIIHQLDLSLITIAIILGALGSVPEHGIALIGAREGLTELGLANLLAGISQAILVVFGSIALIVAVPLGDYVLFQLLAVATSLWLTKKSILDDGKLTIEEGVFILILQILLFVLLEELAYL
ncbi:MAG: hypothetical protein GWO20_09530 [Candidatus Korarchaeota archaeon]|nr:hypothetical protein [Candidatus Korarchaeota archaeon]NIU83697.1 hypothetical protein [Candidatus Thorarchaeota archaeon]NIW14882.1 hypothetical protein [Candidatus Thorarchaeota archaeon]NIW52014.1 hypothetical protein [Candidatus Korarchaeota archaeon]